MLQTWVLVLIVWIIGALAVFGRTVEKFGRTIPENPGGFIYSLFFWWLVLPFILVDLVITALTYLSGNIQIEKNVVTIFMDGEKYQRLTCLEGTRVTSVCHRDDQVWINYTRRQE
jgi:hypothetical protein